MGTSKCAYIRKNIIINCYNSNNLWTAANVLTQKFPAQEFEVKAKVNISGLKEGEETGQVAQG